MNDREAIGWSSSLDDQGFFIGLIDDGRGKCFVCDKGARVCHNREKVLSRAFLRGGTISHADHELLLNRQEGCQKKVVQNTDGTESAPKVNLNFLRSRRRRQCDATSR